MDLISESFETYSNGIATRRIPEGAFWLTVNGTGLRYDGALDAANAPYLTAVGKKTIVHLIKYQDQATAAAVNFFNLGSGDTYVNDSVSIPTNGVERIVVNTQAPLPVEGAVFIINKEIPAGKYPYVYGGTAAKWSAQILCSIEDA